MNTKPLHKQLGLSFSVRATLDLIEVLDELVEQQRSVDPGRLVSRSDIVRQILMEATKETREALAERKR